MAESLSDTSECLGITPYQFEPTYMSINGIVKISRAILTMTRRVLPTDLVTPRGAYWYG